MVHIIFCLITVVLLFIWHKKFQMPSEYILIKGEIETYQSSSEFYARKRLIEYIDIFSLSKAKKVVFRTVDGKRIAFNAIYYKNALWRQLGNYHPNSLVGNFCLMKQHGKVYFFAFGNDSQSVVASSDLYFPLSTMGKISLAIRFFFGVLIFYSLISPIGFLLSLPFQRESYVIIDAFFSTSFVVYGYFIYFNIFSKYPKEIYKKQIELIKQAGMAEPLI